MTCNSYVFWLIYGCLQRYEIINGTTEVQVTKNETAVAQEGDKAREGTSQRSNSNYSCTAF